jgi:outer membrane protein TolC
MKNMVASLIIGAGIVAAQAFAQKLTFDEAVRRAVHRSTGPARARLAVAIANDRYLEAQSKFRWEFRPRIGLLAFSNPALLASSIGMGMAFGRTQPPAWVRQAARLDALAAEVTLERTEMTAQFEVSRHYLQVLLRQQAREELMDAVRQHRISQRTLQERSRAARATALDEAVWETRMIAIEAQLEDAESSLEEAAVMLARTIGVENSAEMLQLAELASVAPGTEVLNATTLQNVVFKRRNEETKLRAKLNAERNRILGKSTLAVNPVSVTYGHLSERGGSALSVGQGGYLLGGHTGAVDLSMKMSLRRTGEDEAMADLAAARIKSIELDLESIGETFHHEVSSLRAQVLASKRRAELAARRLKLSTEVSRLVSVREQSGLESAEALLNAEAELVRVRTVLALARAETETRLTHLLATCELVDAEGAKTVLAGRANMFPLDTQSNGAIQ